MVRRSSKVSPSLEAAVVEPAGQRRGRIELGGNLGPARAFAHHADIAPAAQRELQRVDQDRLARAGLAGQHREAGPNSTSSEGTMTKSRSESRRSISVARPQRAPKQPPRIRLCRSASGAPLGGSAEGATGGGHTTPSYQRSLRRSVA